MSNRDRSYFKQPKNYTQGKHSRTPYGDSHGHNQQGFENYGQNESSYTNRTSHTRHTRTESFPVNNPFKRRVGGEQTRDGATTQQSQTTRPKQGFQKQNRFSSSPSQTNSLTEHSQPRSHTPSNGEWRPKTAKKGGKADMVMFEHETLEKSLGSTEKKKVASGKTNKSSESTLDDSKEHVDITIHDIKDASKHIHMVPVADKIKPSTLSLDVKVDSEEAERRGGSAPPLRQEENKAKITGNITIELPITSEISNVTGGHWPSGRHPSGRGHNRGHNHGHSHGHNHGHNHGHGHSRGRGRRGNQRHEWTSHSRQLNAGYYRGALTPSYDPNKGGRRQFPLQFPQSQRGGYRQGLQGYDRDRHRHPIMYSPQTPDLSFPPVYGYDQQWYGNEPIHQNPYYPPQRQMRNDEMAYLTSNHPGYRGYAYTPVSMAEAYYQQAYDPVSVHASTGIPVSTSYGRAQTPPPRVSSKRKLVTESFPEKIKAQVEYYFSEENLKSDEFLQGLMDSEGWVKARFLEQFPRLKKMQVKAKDIVAAVARSDLLQTLNNKIRRKNDWNKFLPAEEKLSNRFLEAMAIRIEDHHAKLDKLKKLKGSNTEKKRNKTFNNYYF